MIIEIKSTLLSFYWFFVRACMCGFLILCQYFFVSAQTLPEKLPSQQLIVVQTADWQEVKGSLTLYEWQTTDKHWDKIVSFPVIIGRKGMAWGAGLQAMSFNRGKLKKEGDGKTPAGIFSLEALYGYAPTASDKMPYLQAKEKVLCIDDSKSKYYNQIVHLDSISQPDWDSFEQMRRADAQYQYGIVVGYNSPIAVKEAGSCIFFHLWRSSDAPTAGCTAMSKENMLILFEKLKASKSPLVVQAPLKAYHQLKKRYLLP